MLLIDYLRHIQPSAPLASAKMSLFVLPAEQAQFVAALPQFALELCDFGIVFV